MGHPRILPAEANGKYGPTRCWTGWESLLNGRTIRRIISSLRQDGNPICSSGRGYYFARTQDEINDTVSRLNGLVTGVSNARTGLLYAKIVPNTAVEIIIRFGGSMA